MYWKLRCVYIRKQLQSEVEAVVTLPSTHQVAATQTQHVPLQYADHQIGHISAVLCTFHHVERTPTLRTPSCGHGNNCRSEECLDACVRVEI